MGILGSLVGLSGSIFAGASAAKAANQANEILDSRAKNNQDWYNKYYNMDMTQRSDAQSAIAKMRELMQQRSKSTTGSAIVSGSSDSRIAAEKASQNDAIGGAIQNIAANADARRDAIENRYLSTKDAINDAKINTLNQKASNMITAGQSAVQAGMGITNAFGGNDNTK